MAQFSCDDPNPRIHAYDLSCKDGMKRTPSMEKSEQIKHILEK